MCMVDETEVIPGMFDKQECYNVACTAFDVSLLRMGHCEKFCNVCVW